MFIEEVNRVAKIIKPMVKEKRIKIASHFDADGLSSAAIVARLMLRLGVNFQLSVHKQLTDDAVEELKENIAADDLLILTDFGSGQLKKLKSILDTTYVLILDHHEPLRSEHPNLFHLNPLLFGEEEISASMVCYLFAKALDASNSDLIDLAILGAVGDMLDENWKFEGTARKLLAEAETLGKVSISHGLRLFGRNTRPLHKALEYSYDPAIPGITGSESHAVQFLSDLDIDVRSDGGWKRLSELTEEEQKVLASAIVMQRLKFDEEEAADIFGEVYDFTGKPSELQDAREFATLVNACGRTGNIDVGLQLCMGDYTALPRTWTIEQEYKRMISSAMDFVRDNGMRREEHATYILAGSNIPEEIIGTVSSISLNSNMVDRSKPLIGFADSTAGKVKVSARIARNPTSQKSKSKPNDLKLNLRNIIVKAAAAVDGEAGGHPFAAGALIEKEREEEFIAAVEKELRETKGDIKSEGEVG